MEGNSIDKKCLEPGYFIDSDHPGIIAFAAKYTQNSSGATAKAVSLYYAVRDLIPYTFYGIKLERKRFKASYVLNLEAAFCIQKAVLMAAVARAADIPSRLGFADVRNHLATEKLLRQMRTNVFAFHGYTELFLNGKWVKATPAFNLSLCEKFGVKPLEFDGLHDSVFHPFDEAGSKHMEYLRDYGVFEDLPYELMAQSFCEAFPHLFGKNGAGWPEG